MAGEGPTWLNAYVSLPDKNGRSHLVSTYAKIKNHLTIYERGLCVWNDTVSSFEPLRVLWKKAEGKSEPLVPDGHPSLWKDENGKEWLLFGNPLPELQLPGNLRGLARLIHVGKTKASGKVYFRNR